jgi:hypothetical protein
MSSAEHSALRVAAFNQMRAPWSRRGVGDRWGGGIAEDARSDALFQEEPGWGYRPHWPDSVREVLIT